MNDRHAKTSSIDGTWRGSHLSRTRCNGTMSVPRSVAPPLGVYTEAVAQGGGEGTSQADPVLGHRRNGRRLRHPLAVFSPESRKYHLAALLIKQEASRNWPHRPVCVKPCGAAGLGVTGKASTAPPSRLTWLFERVQFGVEVAFGGDDPVCVGAASARLGQRIDEVTPHVLAGCDTPMVAKAVKLGR